MTPAYRRASSAAPRFRTNVPKNQKKPIAETPKSIACHFTAASFLT
jgi:hypothetical protein